MEDHVFKTWTVPYIYLLHAQPSFLRFISPLGWLLRSSPCSLGFCPQWSRIMIKSSSLLILVFMLMCLHPIAKPPVTPLTLPLVSGPSTTVVPRQPWCSRWVGLVTLWLWITSASHIFCALGSPATKLPGALSILGCYRQLLNSTCAFVLDCWFTQESQIQTPTLALCGQLWPLAPWTGATHLLREVFNSVGSRVVVLLNSRRVDGSAPSCSKSFSIFKR